MRFSLSNNAIPMLGVSGQYMTSDLLVESWVPEGATGIPMYKLNQLHCIRIYKSKGRRCVKVKEMVGDGVLLPKLTLCRQASASRPASESPASIYE